MGLLFRRRLHRSRSGRVPYSLVAIVILASVLALSLDLSSIEAFQNTYTAYDVPEETQAALVSVEEEISQAAHFDLLNATAQILNSCQYGTGCSAPLSLLNATTNTLFTRSLQGLGLTGPGITSGGVTVTVQTWGLNVTYAQGSVVDPTTDITSTAVHTPDLNLPAVADPTYPDANSTTQENLYPMAIGTVTLLAVNPNAASTETTVYTYTTTLQSEIGLLESQGTEFADDSFGAGGGFARLVTYIATTMAEMRALAGYGSGGFPGPHADSTVAQTGGNAILSTPDIVNATSLALLLESLRYFRSYDANAVNSFLSALPPGSYQDLIDRYVNSGTVDSAALYLLLVNSPNDPYGIGTISTGEGLAQGIYSFIDRFKFDLLQQFWDQNVTDPTLTDPVADWNLIGSQSQAYLQDQLYQWLNDYSRWLGVVLDTIPAASVKVTIQAETGTAGGCTYTILPAGTLTVSTNGVANIADLILGTANEAAIQQQGQDLDYYMAPQALNLWENVTIGSNWCDGGSGCPIGALEQVGYYVVQHSLLGEYNQGNDTEFDLLNSTLFQIINDVSASMDHKSSTNTDVTDAGLLDYLATAADYDGQNYTWTGAGLPDLSNVAGAAQALNASDYSLLENGSSTLIQGPYASGLTNVATQFSSPTFDNNAWINGASHPGLLGTDDNYPGPDPWAMSDIARLTAREWFQAIYNLYYATSGNVSTSPVGIIDGQPMDAWQYDVVSNGVDRNPPVGFNQPNFAMDVQNETYISAMAWMGWQDPLPPYGQYECGYPNGPCGDTATSLNPAYMTGPGICQTAAYDNAVNYWYGSTAGLGAHPTHTTEEGPGLPSHTWNNIRNATLAALNSPGGVDYDIHPLLTTSWTNVLRNTGDADWGGTAFTNWILQYIGSPILNDTVYLGEVNGWLDQVFNSTRDWIDTGANTTGTVYRPMLVSHTPYTFWYGNETNASLDAALFQESLSAMRMSVGAGTLSWAAPATTVHLVDPQDPASNMGISPYTSTWEIGVHGDAYVDLTATQGSGSLGSNGFPAPAQLNLTIPLDFDANATLYTPWALGSGWDSSPTKVAGDPTPVQTRGLLGLEGIDHSTTSPTALLPGIYVSPILNTLFQDTSVSARLADSDGLLLEPLMAGAPDRIIGDSAAWAENLTTLESDTNTDLASTAGLYIGAVQNDLTTLATELAVPGHAGTVSPVLTSHRGAEDAYFGQNFEADLTGKCLAYFDTGVNPTSACGTAFTAYAPQTVYALDFSGTQVSAALAVDDQYNGAPPVAPNAHGFEGSFGGAGAYTLEGNWIEFGTHYELTLAGPNAPPALDTASSSYPDLGAPDLGHSYPAILSVSGEGGLPQAATTAFRQSIGAWLPHPGVFEDYVTEQLYAAGYLYDSLTSATPPTQAGVTELAYSTLLELTGTHAVNDSVQFQAGAGLFGSPAQEANTLAFLAWFELNYRALSYDLSAPSADPTVLSTAEPLVLMDAYRGSSFVEGDPGTPTMLSWSDPNLAFTEADLGGASGGLADSPTVELGGWVSAQGGWGYAGSLVAA